MNVEDFMINFEEELEKYQPSLEVEEIEQTIYQNDLIDALDIVKEILKDLQK